MAISEKKLSTSRLWHVWTRRAASLTVWRTTCRASSQWWTSSAELDLGDITDVINTERKNAFHEDEVIQEYTPDKPIEPNAPDFQCGGVAVPRVVE